MSLDHLAHVLPPALRTWQEGYRYLEMRAHLGNPQCWDRPAHRVAEIGRRQSAWPRKPTQQRSKQHVTERYTPRVGNHPGGPRYWQANDRNTAARTPEYDIASDSGEFEPLGNDEIDTLCEQLNTRA